MTETYDVILSLKGEAAIVRVSIDGTMQWGLYGDGSIDGPLPSTFTLVGDNGDPTFALQHHPVLRPDGHLTLIDNAKDRGLELALDESASTATFVASWPMSALDCPIQSSLFDLPGGGKLLTCTDDRTWIEFDAAGAEVGRTTLACQNGAVLPRTIRVEPLDLWDGTSAGGVDVQRL